MFYHASHVASSLTSQDVSKMLLCTPRLLMSEKHTAALCRSDTCTSYSRWSVTQVWLHAAASATGLLVPVTDT